MKYVITEKQRKKLLESGGVPMQELKIAEELAAIIAHDYAYQIYYEYKEKGDEYEREREEALEDDDEYFDYYNTNPWEDLDENIREMVDGEFYEINIFYEERLDGNRHASTDYEEIYINFKGIKKIIDMHESYLEDAVNKDYKVSKEELIKIIRNRTMNSIENYLAPILIHELTHIKNGGVMDNDSKWLRTQPHRYVEDDVRECLALFSQEEMNSRVAAAGSMMYRSLVEDFGWYEDGDDYNFANYNDFKAYVDDTIINNIYGDALENNTDFLLLHQMETFLSLWKNNMRWTSKNYLKRTSIPYSTLYYLFKNDSRLRNNRKLDYLFKENFRAGEKYVYDFYYKKYTEFKNRIYKACWASYDKFLTDKKNGNIVQRN